MPMLIQIQDISQISYSAVMDLYSQDLRESAEKDYPSMSAPEALLAAEQDFYSFLADVFFQTPQACMYVWREDGKWVSCLRLEPYEDGLLICGITTDPACRRCGYARMLLEAVLEMVDCPVYAHVEKSNEPSLALHSRCGFIRQLEYAKMLNGEMLHNFCTFYRGK